MHSLGIHYYPLTLPFLLVLLGVLTALSFLVVLRALQFAYAQLGIAPRYFFTWLFASLAGSYINLPVTRFSPEQMTQLQVIPFYGVPYVIPTVETWPGTILAVNVGGAILPILLSLILIVKNGLYRNAAWGVTVVSLAYVCGSLGTLIGADLMNLGNIRGLGAPVMSIGGAGTFDGIFVTGLIAVLLAGILSRRKLARSARQLP